MADKVWRVYENRAGKQVLRCEPVRGEAVVQPARAPPEVADARWFVLVAGQNDLCILPLPAPGQPKLRPGDKFQPHPNGAHLTLGSGDADAFAFFMAEPLGNRGPQHGGARISQRHSGAGMVALAKAGPGLRPFIGRVCSWFFGFYRHARSAPATASRT